MPVANRLNAYIVFKVWMYFWALGDKLPPIIDIFIAVLADIVQGVDRTQDFVAFAAAIGTRLGLVKLV